MKTVIIIQARMTSTRLPGKVLKTVMDKPLLEYQIERLKRIKAVDEIIVATTVNSTDEPIVDFCRKLNIAVYRGSEHDVLSRYYEAAVKHQADVVVRVTSDCPVIDSDLIEDIITYYNTSKKYDYVSNCQKRTYPRGMDTEVFSFKCLSEAFNQAEHLSEREHVTPYIYNHPDNYKLGDFKADQDYSRYRLTVDTMEDYELIKNILEYLYPTNPNFKLKDILYLLTQNPQWYLINAHVEQKKVGE